MCVLKQTLTTKVKSMIVSHDKFQNTVLALNKINITYLTIIPLDTYIFKNSFRTTIYFLNTSVYSNKITV